MSNKEIGNNGEKEIIELVSCPNYKKKLMPLPVNYPLVDVQCTGCIFRAQVKTVNSKPKSLIFGAGWEIMNKVLKSGFMIPLTFVNFKWADSQEIRFYPFIPKINLESYQLSPEAKRSNYKMFHYKNIDKLPYFIVYKK